MFRKGCFILFGSYFFVSLIVGIFYSNMSCTYYNETFLKAFKIREKDLKNFQGFGKSPASFRNFIDFSLWWNLGSLGLKLVFFFVFGNFPFLFGWALAFWTIQSIFKNWINLHLADLSLKSLVGSLNLMKISRASQRQKNGESSKGKNFETKCLTVLHSTLPHPSISRWKK